MKKPKLVGVLSEYVVTYHVNSYDPYHELSFSDFNKFRDEVSRLRLLGYTKIKCYERFTQLHAIDV